MKNNMSFACDPRRVHPHGEKRASDGVSAPLGLVGHLRAALDAWHAERDAMKAHIGSLPNASAMNDLSKLTVAESHELCREHSGEFAQTGDVLSGLVLNWPSPSGKHH